MTVAIVGSCGKLGTAVCEKMSKSHTLVTIDKSCGEFSSIEKIKDIPDIIIDVSCHENSIKTLKFAQKHAIPVVLACTWHTPEEIQEIEKASKNMPIFLAYNMAYGVQVFKNAAKMIGKQFGENAHLHEIHHALKKDAPSGTAREVAKIFTDLDKELSITSARGGTVIGTHEIVFFSQGERIVLTHIAESRECFASGIEKATEFLLTMPNGLYNMNDLCNQQLRFV